MSHIRAAALGRWPDLLVQAGVSPEALTGGHVACPACGGKDRFRFINRDGRGTWVCSGHGRRQASQACGAGDGFDLLMDLLCNERRDNQAFATAATFIEQWLGGSSTPPITLSGVCPSPAKPGGRSSEEIKASLRALLRSSQPAHRLPHIRRYLNARGLGALEVIPTELRIIPQLWCYEGSGAKLRKVGQFPTMVAPFRRLDGAVVCVHRTYLDKDGRGKAPVAAPKKVTESLGLNGEAIQLFAAGPELAVTEGIETALAVHLMTGLPVWALGNEGNLRKFQPPPDTRLLHIYADNDALDPLREVRIGTDAAQQLARTMQEQGMACKIHLPKKEGQDFLDVYNERMRLLKQRVA